MMVCQGKLGYPLGPGEKPSFNNDLLPDVRVELLFFREIPGRSQTSEQIGVIFKVTTMFVYRCFM